MGTRASAKNDRGWEMKNLIEKLNKAIEILEKEGEFRGYYGSTSECDELVYALEGLKEIEIYLNKDCRECHLAQSWQNHIESMKQVY